jgi:hypothetical protein
MPNLFLPLPDRTFSGSEAIGDGMIIAGFGATDVMNTGVMERNGMKVTGITVPTGGFGSKDVGGNRPALQLIFARPAVIFRRLLFCAQEPVRATPTGF